MGKSFFEAERKDSGSLLAVSCATTGDGKATMTVTESKGLQKGTRVYWRGDAADSGIISETSWDAVTIIWNNGKVASVHHGDMREIQRAPTNSHTVQK
jgi:hypothetical protein